MGKYIDPLRFHTFMDSNLADEIEAKTTDAIKSILEWENNGEICLIRPHSVKSELEDASTPAAIQKIAYDGIYTMQVGVTMDEVSQRQKFIEECRGDAQAKNIDGDLRHVWELTRYGGGYFLTRDIRLQKRADMILSMTMVVVVSPEQFVEKVLEAKRRDEQWGQQ